MSHLEHCVNGDVIVCVTALFQTDDKRVTERRSRDYSVIILRRKTHMLACGMKADRNA